MALWHDVRFAATLLIKDRWFTAVAATALALVTRSATGRWMRLAFLPLDRDA